MMGTGPGQPLDAPGRGNLERLSPAPLDRVRIHDDPDSRVAAALLGSQAYALGEHIVLGDPAFSDVSPTWLLAHEVAHTIQQRPDGPLRGACNPEFEANRFADAYTALTPHPQLATEIPILTGQAKGLAPRVIARQTLDLPGNLLLVIDIDDGDFVGGCVRAIVPHIGVKLIMKGVPKGLGNQIFNLHIGYVTNPAGQSCIFFYESVSGICELKCYESEEEREQDEEGIREWLENLVRRVLEIILVALLAYLLALLLVEIVEAIIAALAALALVLA